MYSTRWATTHLDSRRSNMRSIMAFTRPFQPKTISGISGSNWTISGFVTTGTAKCVPVIRNITNGRSGSSCNCSTAITTGRNKKQNRSRNSLKNLKPRALPIAHCPLPIPSLLLNGGALTRQNNRAFSWTAAWPIAATGK